MRRVRFVVAAALALLAVAAFATSAQAHGRILRTYPADGAVLTTAPQQVRLWFNERVDQQFSSVEIADMDGRAVSVSGPFVDPIGGESLILGLPAIGDGVYQVRWNVLSSVDAHVTRGTFVFRVGAGVPVRASAAAGASLPVSAVESGLRWASLMAMALLLGSLAVRELVLPRNHPLLARSRARSVDIARGAAVVAIAIGLVWLFWQASVVSGTSISRTVTERLWWSVLVDTRWGALWLARQAILAAIFAALVLRRNGRVTGLASLLLTAPLAITQALTSHAAGLTSEAAIAIAADTLHLLAAGLWIGGLAATVLVLRRANQPDRASSPVARAVWLRFGALAATSATVLVATGIYATGRQVASPDALLTTFYGQALIGKVTLVMGVVVIGAINAVSIRTLRRRPPAVGRVRHLAVAEALVGAGVLLGAALISSAAPPRGPEFAAPPPPAQSFLSHAAGDLRLTLAIQPNQPGANILTVGAFNTRRPAPAEITGVTVRLTSPDPARPPVIADARDVGGGQYRLAGDDLGSAGPWDIEVAAHRRGMADVAATFAWTVAGQTEGPQPRRPVFSTRPLRSPLTVASLLVLASGTAALGAFLLLAYMRSRTGTARLALLDEAT